MPKADEAGKEEETLSQAAEEMGQVLEQVLPEPQWANAISPDEWRVCQRAIHALREFGVEFLIGGAFGLAVYTGRLRDTKDIDLFTVPERVSVAIEALAKASFEDYYAKLPYDRGWIYRSTREGFIVDIIFKMANRRAPVDPVWFERATRIWIKGEVFKIIPAEELLWQKLYVLQRDRCDWPDVINLLYAKCGDLNWEHLFYRMGSDLPLLKGVMQLFGWLCPERCAQTPATWREQLGLEPLPEIHDRRTQEYRASLLDSRNWFVPNAPVSSLLEV